MTPAGEKLDQFLTQAVNDLGGKDMPEIGAKASIGSIKGLLAEVKSVAEAAKNDVASALKAMAADIEANGKLVAQKVRQEHEETMAAFNELLGNERAGDDTKA